MGALGPVGLVLPSPQASLNMTSALNGAAAGVVALLLQLTLPTSSCAMVSPGHSVMVATLPLPAALKVEPWPALSAVNRLARPCERPLTSVAMPSLPVTTCEPCGAWQPLQLSTSPGCTVSQERCSGKPGNARALASRTVIWKATCAGTITRTEPSGSMGT